MGLLDPYKPPYPGKKAEQWGRERLGQVMGFKTLGLACQFNPAPRHSQSKFEDSMLIKERALCLKRLKYRGLSQKL